jgi:hypothetical protein
LDQKQYTVKVTSPLEGRRLSSGRNLSFQMLENQFLYFHHVENLGGLLIPLGCRLRE